MSRFDTEEDASPEARIIRLAMHPGVRSLISHMDTLDHVNCYVELARTQQDQDRVESARPYLNIAQVLLTALPLDEQDEKARKAIHAYNLEVHRGNHDLPIFGEHWGQA